MLANIVDKRTNKYVVDCDAAFEPSWHDNKLRKGTPSTKFPQDDTQSSFEEMSHSTVAECVKYANQLKGNITMYLYDPGSQAEEHLISGESLSSDLN